MSITSDKAQKRLRGEDTHASMAEVAEFLLGGQSFGINGSKIKQLVPFDESKVTRPPYNHPAVIGVFMFRGSTVPLIDLCAFLQVERSSDAERQVAVVTEFNETTTAFVADKVDRIHRISWTMLKPLDNYLVAQAPQIIGTITIEDHEVLVLDLEQIVGEIIPESVVNYDEQSFDASAGALRREKVRVFFAEDSFIIRSQLEKVMNKVGYTQVTPFAHGQAALEAIEQAVAESEAAGEPISSRVNLLVTDIEMPQMDGLLLCETVKKRIGLDLPVLMFSSLINEQVAKKCRAAGADNWVSKPQTERLIELMDELTLAGGGSEPG